MKRLSALAVVMIVLVSCGPEGLDADAELDPAAASSAVARSAATSGNVSVTWSIQEAGCGAIGANGLYTAPTSGTVCHVAVASQANPAVKSTATVTVTAPVTPPPPPPPPPPPSGNVITVAQDGTGNYSTIQAAVNAATAGTTVRIKAGVYHEVVTMRTSGTASAPITLQGDPGVYVDGDVDGNAATLPTLPASNGGGMIAGSSLSYLNFVNLNVRNVNGHGYRLSASHHITIQGGSISYTQDGGIYFNNPSSYITIDGVDIHHTNQEGATASSEAISFSGTQHFEVKNCKVHDNAEDGIDAKDQAAFGAIHHNDVYRNATMQSGATSIYVDEALDLDIYANKIHACGSGGYCFALGIEGATAPHATARIRFFNNLIFDVPNEGIGFWGTPTDASWSDIQIFNNTFYNVTSRAFVVNKSTSFFSGTNVFRNNLMWQVQNVNNWGVLFGTGLGAFAIDHNLFSSSASSVTYGTSAVRTSSVGMVDPVNGNFALQGTSPAIDVAATALAPSSDFGGAARPVGAGPDIGAYEYVP